jgi:hypothetical protein
MAPVEYRREMAAASLRRLDEERRDVALAWYVAAFSRQDKLKALRTVLQPFDAAEPGLKFGVPGHRQTRAQQLAAMATISANAGIPMRFKHEVN